jgi:Mg-chelatase subunit ChlD
MNGKRFLAGLPALILVPTLVLAVLAAAVYALNARPQAGPLQARVRPQVVWPWQQAAELMTVEGDLRKAAKPPRPVDMVFLVDVSGSMTESLPAMAKAAYGLARDLARSQPGRVRFALIRFDTDAAVNTDWTSDPEKLQEGLGRLTPFTGQNDTRAAFQRLAEVLRGTRPGAAKVAVFYTDGGLVACPFLICLGREMDEPEIVAAAEKLRGQGVDFYSIGLPGQPSSPLMVEVTGSAARVFESGSAGDLARNFGSLGTSLGAGTTSGGVLTNRLDGRYFAAPIAGTGWALEPSGALQLQLGQLPLSRVTYWHPLVPRAAGLWPVGVEPPHLTFVDPRSGQAFEVAAERRPLLLVISWLTLLLAALPLFLWLLANLLPRRVQRPEEAELPALPERQGPPPPSRLPALPRLDRERREVVPTLFVGLGASGRRALLAARADLKQSHLGDEGWPYRFLALDLDQRQPEAEELFEPWEAYPLERLLAPPEVTRTSSYLPQADTTPAHWSWFDGECYRDAAREELSLAEGSRGDRALARLALFRWLELGGPQEALLSASQDLAAAPAVDGLRQVVVFASRDGGWGSGTFLDFGRLLQRIGRRHQRSGVLAIAPEVIGVLCDSPERQRPENRDALAMEIQSATLAGGFPSRTTYLPGHDLLDGADSETPYHRILAVSGRDGDAVAAQCGDLAAVLVERRPRLSLLETVSQTAAEGGGPVPVAVRGVYVAPTQAREQVHLDLLLRLLGPDVLFDVQPAPGGGFAAAAVREETASQLLAEWALAEPAGVPLRLLLAASQDPAATPLLLQVYSRTASAVAEALQASLVAAVNARLRGERSEGGEWHRGWAPSHAIAVLRLLARRIEALTATLGTGTPAEVRAMVSEFGSLASACAEALAGWLAAFCDVCEELSRERVRLAVRSRRKERLRLMLDGMESPAQVESWSRECLERWLGTPDTVSPLRERLFLAISADGAGVQIALRSFIGQPQRHLSAGSAVAELTALTRSLSRLAPLARIGVALSRLPEPRRAEVARSLVDRQSRPLHTLLLAPAAEGTGVEALGSQDFLAAVPQPADHGVRQEIAADDPSAVRRLEALAAQAPLGASSHLIEEAEKRAEMVRRRLEEKYSLAIPVLPPELRIALAHPEGMRAFSKAYRTGRIERRPDATGRAQWYSVDGDCFLTFGSQSGLAAAAASYVWNGLPAARDPEPGQAPGDFSEVHQWVQNAGMPGPEVLALAALELFAS